MNISWFSSIIFILSVHMVSAQVISEFDYKRLDDYLLQSEFNKIKNYFAEKDSVINAFRLSESEFSEYEKDKNMYFNLITYFDSILDLEKEELLKKINKLKMRKNSFNIAIAGEKSNSYFNSFLNKIDEKKNLTALKIYYLAYNHKQRFNRENKREMLILLEEAEKLLRERNYREANIILQYIKLKAKKLYFSKEILNKIAIVSEKSENRLLEEDTEEELFRQKELFTKRILIYSGFRSSLYGINNNKNQTLKFTQILYDVKTEYTYPVEKLEFISGYAFRLGTHFYLYKNYNLGISIEKGNNKYYLIREKSELRSEQIIKYYSCNLEMNYLFKYNTGVRPYTGIGFNFYFATREKIIAEKTWYSSLELNKKNFFLSIIPINIGLEYIHPRNTNLVFRIVFSSSFLLTNSPNFSPVQYAFGIQGGYAF